MGKGDPRAKARRLTREQRRRLKSGQAAPTKPGARTADGTLSEARDARPRQPEPPAPTTVVRMRDHGLEEQDARTQLAGTGHGRLVLAGLISHEAWQVAERYRRLEHAYQRTIAGPKESASAAIAYERDWRPTRGDSGPDSAAGIPPAAVETADERDERVRRDWEAVQAAFAHQDALVGALNAVAVRDVDVRRDDRQLVRFVGALSVLCDLWSMDRGLLEPARKAG